MSDHLWFERLAEGTSVLAEQSAPASLKSKVYSTLLTELASSGRLLDLAETMKAGGHLCVFERTLTVLPVGTHIRSMNPCRICHARLLGERLDRAPVFWPGCPYADFHHG